MNRKLALLAFSMALTVSAMAQMTVSINDILTEYKTNPIAADAKYLKKPVSLSLKVQSIEMNHGKEYYVVPVVGAGRARCYFSESQNEALSKIKKGDDLALHGICKGFDRERGNNHLVIAECKFGFADAPQGTTVNSLASIKKSLVILKDNEGEGSGFIASLDGTKYVVTNFHVFAANDNIKLIDCDNREIAVKSIRFAADRDIALFELEDQDAYDPIELQPDIATLQVGTPVVVYGNSNGKEVFTEIKGKILGTGPSLIETDAGFIPGNSGSPVLNFPELKLLGVATCASPIPDKSWTLAGTRFQNAVRRFATRVDNLDIAKTELYDKKTFDLEIKAYRNLSNLLNTKLYALRSLKHVGSGDETDWNLFLLYSGKLQDSGRKSRLVTLIQQWNREIKNLNLPTNETEHVTNTKNVYYSNPTNNTQDRNKLGINNTPSISIQKLPFEDLNRLLFTNDPKPKFTYKRLQKQADEMAEESKELQKIFRESFDNIKALLKK